VVERIPFYSFERKRCSQCDKIHSLSEMFYNKRKGNYWCMHCVSIEKKKRNAIQWEKRLGRDLKNVKIK
jgi:hypothetical protein